MLKKNFYIKFPGSEKDLESYVVEEKKSERFVNVLYIMVERKRYKKMNYDRG